MHHNLWDHDEKLARQGTFLSVNYIRRVKIVNDYSCALGQSSDSKEPVIQVIEKALFFQPNCTHMDMGRVFGPREPRDQTHGTQGKHCPVLTSYHLVLAQFKKKK